MKRFAQDLPAGPDQLKISACQNFELLLIRKIVRTLVKQLKTH